MTTLGIIATILLIVIGVVVIVELGVLTALLLRVSKMTQQVRDRIDPVIDQSTKLLHTANDVADTVKNVTPKVSDTVMDVSEQVREHIGPVMDESTRLLHTANDVARTVKTDTAKVGDTVVDITRQVQNHAGPVMDESTRLLHTVNDVADTVKNDTAKVGDTVMGVTQNIAHRVDQTAATMQRVTDKTVEQLSRPPVLAGLTVLAGVGTLALLRRVLSWPVVAMFSIFTTIAAGLRAWQLYQQQPAENRVPLRIRPAMRRRAA